MERKHVKLQTLAESDAITEGSLYAKRKKIYPREVHGVFAKWRLFGIITLLGIYYIMPWINLDGHQALLFDLPNRQFHIIWWTFWPQDFIYLTFFLIIAAIALFFFTALAGRVWCGYACPQTVWTEVFLWFERRIEGDRNKQIKLDKEPWDAHKLKIKGAKHFVWIVFSLYTGFTFVGYFSPIRELTANVFSFSLGPWETFWIFFYSVATWGNAGFLREQVCIYMCPYARFQGVMFDANTLVITYDANRGDPRGSRRRDSDHREKGLGDCIDCKLCVQVCPTGIDIRDGLQYQCIGCAACIDVCDSIMDRMDYPRGLISYTTENALEGKPTKIMRPRIFVYSTLLLGFILALGFMIASRLPLELDIIRDRNSLYRETNEGLIENVYTLKLLNMDNVAHQYTLTATGLDGMNLVVEKDILHADPNEVVSVPVRISIDPVELSRPVNKIEFTLSATENQELTVTEDAKFIGPRL